MPFRPQVNSQIIIDSETYLFVEHPAAKGMPYGQTGRRATVYQVKDSRDHVLALKVFTKAFRTPYYERSAPKLRTFAELPGLSVCQRQVLTQHTHNNLISSYPDLEYAVLMPWITGKTWQEIIVFRQPITTEQCLKMATELANIVANMEENGVAHCDLSGPNILVTGLSNGSSNLIGIVDVEELYGPDLEQPEQMPAGTPGYNHRVAQRGLWNSEADRFAGAVLLVEMLIYNDNRVRNIIFGEHYFAPNEMQTTCDRYYLAQQVLKEQGFTKISDLFARAWFSTTLQECPSLAEWYKALINPTVDIEDLKQSILADEKKGNWSEVLKDVKYLLDAEPMNSAWLSLQMRAQRLSQMELAIQQTWNIALESGQVEDWDNCIRLLRTAHNQANEVKRYQERIQQAESEKKLAVRIAAFQQLINENRWKEAMTKRGEIPPNHPLGAHLLAQLDHETERQKRLDEIEKEVSSFIEDRDWQRVIDLCREGLVLNNDNRALSKILENAYIEQDLDLQIKNLIQNAKNAIQNENWSEAETYIQSALGKQPDRNDLKIWLKETSQKIKWADQIDSVKQKLAIDPSLTLEKLLEGIPENFSNLQELKEEIKKAANWKADLQEAKEQFDYVLVDNLLGNIPSSQNEPKEFIDWSHQQAEIHQELQQVQKVYAIELVEDILSRLPDEHPFKQHYSIWIKEIREYESTLRVAIKNFDTETVQDTLSNLSSEHPEYSYYKDWLTKENSRIEAIQESQEMRDLERAELLLSNLPKNHYLYEDYKKWVASEKKFWKQIENAKQLYDLEMLGNLLHSGDNQIESLKEIHLWLKEQLNLKRRLQESKADFDSERMLALLSTAPDNLPGRNDLYAWAEADQKLRQALSGAIDRYSLKDVSDLYSQIPDNHPEKVKTKIWQKDQKIFAKKLNDSYQAFSYKDVLELLKPVTEKYPEYKKFQDWAKKEMNLEERIQNAQKEQNIEELSSILRTVPIDHPKNELIKHIISNIEAKINERKKQLEKAEQKLMENDWESAYAIANQYFKEKDAPARFKEIYEVSHSEIEKRRAADGLVKNGEKALRSEQFEEALSFMIKACEKVPGEAKYYEAFNDLRKKIVELAKVAETNKEWKMAKRLWMALKTNSLTTYSTNKHEYFDSEINKQSLLSQTYTQIHNRIRSGDLETAVNMICEEMKEDLENEDLIPIKKQLTHALLEKAKWAEKNSKWKDAKNWWKLLKKLQDG